MPNQKKDKDAEAKKRSDAARKAAATRKANEKEAQEDEAATDQEGVSAVTAREHASEPQGEESDPVTMSRRPEPVPVNTPPLLEGIGARREARDKRVLSEAKSKD